MFKKILSFVFFIGLGTLTVAQAGVSPLGVSVVPPLEFPPPGFTITGVRLSIIYGQHQSVYGIDLGAIGNVTTQHFGGVQVSGIFNQNRGTATTVGLQFAAAGNFNENKAHIIGIQAAVGVNYNQAETSVLGLQVAAANLSPYSRVIGVEVGLYNRANEVFGFQIGIVNVAESLHGLQIGLLNYHARGVFSVAPILNFGF